MEAKVKLENLLHKHMPEPAVPYCVALWERDSFHFRITKKRATKQGDYRYDQKTGTHRISVNGDLNDFAFLITYVHEYAHLMVRQRFSRRVRPHGKEWQESFRKLMLPLLNDRIFPDDILRPLSRYMRRPGASTHTDQKLVTALRKYDDHGDLVSLEEIDEGVKFVLGGRVYVKNVHRRTRVMCTHVLSGRKYLVPKIALVAVYRDDCSGC